MARKSKKVEKFQDMKKREQIIVLMGKGYQPKAIADEVGCSRQYVNDVLDNALAEYSFRLADQAEALETRTLLRLETLYSEVAKDTFSEGSPGDEMYRPLDTKYAKVLLAIIKEEREWVKMRRDYERHTDENGTINIDKIEVTMTASNDLYHVATDKLQDDWMEGYIDMDTDELYLDKATPVDQKIDRLAEAVGLDYEDLEDSEDDEDDEDLPVEVPSVRIRADEDEDDT